MIIFNYFIIMFIIMCLAALSGLFAERSGTVNIGINGMMLAGGISYWILARDHGGHKSYQLIETLVAVLTGVFSGIVFSIAAIGLKANQIISGTAINMIAGAAGLLLIGSANSQERTIPDPGWALSTDTDSAKNMLSLSLILGLIIIAISFVALKYTSWGLRLKAAGENPQALDSQGVNVIRTRIIALLISGGLAGLAGGIFVQHAQGFSGNVQGIGFVGITILIAGQWRVPYIVIAAAFFAALFSIAENLQTIKASLSEIKPLIQTTPFILSLSFLVIFSKTSRAPKAAGVAYDKTKR